MILSDVTVLHEKERWIDWHDRSNSSHWLRFFLCPWLLSCWLIHLFCTNWRLLCLFLPKSKNICWIISSDNCLKTLSVPRSEQFSESETRGKLQALRNNVHGQISVLLPFYIFLRNWCSFKNWGISLVHSTVLTREHSVTWRILTKGVWAKILVAFYPVNGDIHSLKNLASVTFPWHRYYTVQFSCYLKFQKDETHIESSDCKKL